MVSQSKSNRQDYGQDYDTLDYDGLDYGQDYGQDYGKTTGKTTANRV